jgi:hypothetical protein
MEAKRAHAPFVCCRHLPAVQQPQQPNELLHLACQCYTLQSCNFKKGGPSFRRLLKKTKVLVSRGGKKWLLAYGFQIEC